MPDVGKHSEATLSGVEPGACPSFLFPIFRSPMSEIFLQLWSRFFRGKIRIGYSRLTHVHSHAFRCIPVGCMGCALAKSLFAENKVPLYPRPTNNFTNAAFGITHIEILPVLSIGNRAT